jgi:polar amino acid transport system substrate-binding protein
VTFSSAGQLADAATTGAWDIAFLGNEPERANEILFSSPYVEIDAGYLAPPGSQIRTIKDADAEGVRIAAAGKSAYDLFLTRSLRHATLVRAKGMEGSYELVSTKRADLLAGIKPWLTLAAERLPGSHVLDGRFMAVQQCIGTPKGRESGPKYLQDFVEDIKASGFLADTIRQLDLRGVSIPA